MKLQTVLLVVALVAVAVFLLRQARNYGGSEYRKRFDSRMPQQDSSYLYVPVITSGAVDSSGHHGQSTDCGSGSTDAGGGCPDGGGGSS